MGKNVVIDSSGVRQIFNDLNQEAQKKIILKGITKGAKHLKEETQKTMISKYPKARTAKGKAKVSMYEGVFTKVDRAYTEVKVSVTGNYLNNFFEGGTDERYRKVRYKDDRGRTRISKTQKGGYTGKVEGFHFFRDTREREKDRVIDIIEESVSEEINKITK